VNNWKAGGFRYNSTGIPDFDKHMGEVKDAFYEREAFFNIERQVVEGSVEEAIFNKSRTMLEDANGKPFEMYKFDYYRANYNDEKWMYMVKI
jgi:hypothetical protein